MDKFIFNLFSDVFPSKWQFFYLLIYDFDSVWNGDIKLLEDTFGICLHLNQEFFDFKQNFIRIFAFVIDFLRWHHQFLQFSFNILLELKGDATNILILFSRANYIHLEICSSLSAYNKAIILIIDWFQLKIDLVTHIIPFKVITDDVLVNEVLNNDFSYSILLALLIDYKTFFNGNAFFHLGFNDFIAWCV